MGKVSAWTLIWASTQPVLKVVLLCAVGAFCARKGILDYKGRKVLSSLSYLVFIPALNFISLGSSLTPSRLLHWWPLFVNVFLGHAMGGAAGYLLVKVMPHDAWFRRHIIASVMFGNTGNLPLVIVSTLARTSAEILGGVDPRTAEDLAVSYIIVGLMVSIIAVPVVGYRLLAKHPDDPPGPKNIEKTLSEATCKPGSEQPQQVTAATATTSLVDEERVSLLQGTALGSTDPASALRASAAGGQMELTHAGSGGAGWTARTLARSAANQAVALSDPRGLPLATARQQGSEMVDDGGGDGVAARHSAQGHAARSATSFGTDVAQGAVGGTEAVLLPEGSVAVLVSEPSLAACLGDRGQAAGSVEAGAGADFQIGAGTGIRQELGQGIEGCILSPGVLPRVSSTTESAFQSPATGSSPSGSGFASAAGSFVHLGDTPTIVTSSDGSSREGHGGGGGRWGGSVSRRRNVGGSGGAPAGASAGAAVDGGLLAGAIHEAGDSREAGPPHLASKPAPTLTPQMQLMLSRFTPEFLSFRVPSSVNLRASPSPSSTPQHTPRAAPMGGSLSQEHNAVAHTFHTNTFSTPSNTPGADLQPLLPGQPLSQTHLPFIPSAATTGAAETGYGVASGQDDGLRMVNARRGFHQPAETSRVGHSHSSQPSTSGQHPDGPTHRPIPMPLLLPALMGRRRAAEIVSRSKDVALLALNELLSPPILSTLVGIIVGCVTPLQKLFFATDAPLSVLTDITRMISACAIPSIMIGLGATLANGPGTARVKLSTIISVSVLRLLILPLIGMAMIVGGYMAGVYHAPDAVFILVMLLQNTAPTAILVHTMSAVHQNYDAEVSTLLFWQYVVSIVSSPPYIALFLYTLGTTFHADVPSPP